MTTKRAGESGERCDRLVHVSRVTLSSPDAIRRWCAAARFGGATLPLALKARLLELDWRAGRGLRQRDVIATAILACEEAWEAWDLRDHGRLTPRGCMVSLEPSGSVRLEWQSAGGEEEYVITLGLLGDQAAQEYLMAVLECRSDVAGSPRLRICKGHDACPMCGRTY